MIMDHNASDNGIVSQNIIAKTLKMDRIEIKFILPALTNPLNK